MMLFFSRFLVSALLFVMGPTRTTGSSEPKLVAITLHFTNLKTPKGCLQYGIYKDEESFKNDRPIKLIRVPKSAIINGKVTSTLQLPPGLYGISVLDDENANGLMDYNFVGLPKEGFAFSNYYHEGLSRPVFTQFKFDLQSEPITLVCKFRYM